MSMSGTLTVRQATSVDFDWAWDVYALATKPFMSGRVTWDNSKEKTNFATIWEVDNIRIIMSNGVAIGWFSVCEHPTQVELENIHIVPDFQNKGIGTRYVRELIADWRGKKPVVVGLGIGNYYEKTITSLGFRKTGQDQLTTRFEKAS
jgi:ribosomal protein S18 acetylase RimI-like enzyme